MKNQPFKKFFGIVKQVAPTLLAGVAGPGGLLAATIAKKVLGNEAMSDDQLEEAVATATGTADGLAKLRTIEAELQKAEVEYGFKFQELEVNDRADARAMAEATSILPQVALSALFIVGYFTMMGLFFSEHLTIPMDDSFKILLGVLTASIPQILAFWFGSSIGSKQKTDLMGAKSS